MVKKYYQKNLNKATPFKSFPENFLKLILRVSKYRPDLLHAYWGPANLKNMIDQEPKRPLKELLEQTQALKGEAVRKLINPNRKALYLERLHSLEALIQDNLGKKFEHLEFIES